MFGFGKGKIDLKLEKLNFKPGETIKGTVSLELKEPIQARGLKVLFYGIAKQSQTGFSSSGGVKHRSNTKKIHNFEMTLDGEKEYKQGEYNFKIAIPQNAVPKMPSGALGGMVQAAQFLGAVPNIKWFVEAKLDIPKGFDVRKKIQINIG